MCVRDAHKRGQTLGAGHEGTVMVPDFILRLAAAARVSDGRLAALKSTRDTDAFSCPICDSLVYFTHTWALEIKVFSFMKLLYICTYNAPLADFNVYLFSFECVCQREASNRCQIKTSIFSNVNFE